MIKYDDYYIRNERINLFGSKSAAKCWSPMSMKWDVKNYKVMTTFINNKKGGD